MMVLTPTTMAGMPACWRCQPERAGVVVFAPEGLGRAGGGLPSKKSIFEVLAWLPKQVPLY